MSSELPGRPLKRTVQPASGAPVRASTQRPRTQAGATAGEEAAATGSARRLAGAALSGGCDAGAAVATAGALVADAGPNSLAAAPRDHHHAHRSAAARSTRASQ